MKPGKPEPRTRLAGVSRVDEDAETARLMTNWARWRSGAGVQVAVSGAYDLEARGRREETSIPLLNGEAADVDAAVGALPPELHDVVVEHWLRAGTVERHARDCRCTVRTYYRRLAHAHERIRALLRAKKVEAERRRKDAVAMMKSRIDHIPEVRLRRA